MKREHSDFEVILDHLRGQAPLSDDVLAHVADCPTCVETLRFARVALTWAEQPPGADPGGEHVPEPALIDLVSGQLSPSDAATLEQHLQTCGACASRFARFRSDFDAWDTGLNSVEAGSSARALSSAPMTEAILGQPGGWWRRLSAWLGAPYAWAGALAAAAAVVWVVTARPGAVDPSPLGFPEVPQGSVRGDGSLEVIFDGTVMAPTSDGAEVLAELLPSRWDVGCKAGDIVVLDALVSKGSAPDAEPHHSLWYEAPGAAPQRVDLVSARSRAEGLRRGTEDASRVGFAVEVAPTPGVHAFTAVVSAEGPPALVGAWLSAARRGELGGVIAATLRCTLGEVQQ